ncbi:MAG: isochorismate synthase [Thermoplasmatota archaeon]
MQGHLAAPPRLTSRTRRLAPGERDDALTLLQAAAGTPRGFWVEQQDDREPIVMVAVGAACRITATGPDRFRHVQEAAAELWRRLDHEGPLPPRLLGGFAFHDDHEAVGRWHGFDAAHFILPERLLLWKDGALYENVVEAEGPSVLPEPSRQVGPAAVDDDEAAWTAAVRDALEAIEAGELTKLVLARSPHLDPEADPADVVPRLDPSTRFRFLVEPRAGHAFFGATPELLVKLHGDRLETHALAGSRRAGDDESEAGMLAHDLLTSPKEALEHELVVADIRERLSRRGALVEAQPRRIRRLRHVQHLETPLRAPAPATTHVLDLVAALHPTPAVGGTPRREALAALKRLERFPRGWYAGTVGWFDSEGQGTFATALRCALSTPDATWLFAGAGIVAGSDPRREWQETRVKLRPMREALSR